MTATKLGAASGCTIWAIVAVVLALCLVPVACLTTLFTTTSDFAATVIGPLVCPAGSTASIERVPETYTDDDGFTREALSAEMVCLDAAGEIVAQPAPLPNWIWGGLLTALALVASAALALVLAAPAGVLIARLTRRQPA